MLNHVPTILLKSFLSRLSVSSILKYLMEQTYLRPYFAQWLDVFGYCWLPLLEILSSLFCFYFYLFNCFPSASIVRFGWWWWGCVLIVGISVPGSAYVALHILLWVSLIRCNGFNCIISELVSSFLQVGSLQSWLVCTTSY